MNEDKLQALTELKKLLDSGILNETEFTEQKKKILFGDEPEEVKKQPEPVKHTDSELEDSSGNKGMWVLGGLAVALIFVAIMLTRDKDEPATEHIEYTPLETWEEVSASTTSAETYDNEDDAIVVITDNDLDDSYESNSSNSGLGEDIFESFKKALKGTYLADVSSMLGDLDMMRQYGKFVITEETISSYTWDDRQSAWVKTYTAPYNLIFNASDDYMSGYNLVYQAHGSEMRMCAGDVNGDGNLDIWCNDCIYHTKQ